MSVESKCSPIKGRASPLNRFPLLDRVSYAKDDFPLLESISGGRSPNHRLQRLVSQARKSSQERSSQRIQLSDLTPHNQSILWSPSNQHRTWTSHLWLSYVSVNDRSSPSRSELHHPKWVSVFSPEENCLSTPVKPLKNKDFFRKYLRKRVKIYIAPNDITGEEKWSNSGGLSEDAGAPPRATFDTTEDPVWLGLETPDMKSFSEENPVKVAEDVQRLREQQVALAREEWIAGLLSVRQAAGCITENDLQLLDSIRIPNDVTIAMVGYICVLFGIAPKWTQAKRSTLNDIHSFLVFLQKVLLMW